MEATQLFSLGTGQDAIPLSLVMDKWRCHFTYLSMVKWTEAGKKPVQERQPDLGNIPLNVMPRSFLSPFSTSCCFHFCYKICDIKTWSFLFWYIVSAVLVSEVPRHNLPSLRARRNLGLPFLYPSGDQTAVYCWTWACLLEHNKKHG